MIELPSEAEFIDKAQKIPLQRLQWDLAKQKGVEVLIRRDDLIDECLSGNKYYKLFYSLQTAQEFRCKQILSFGGAYSNHIHALAAAANRYGFNAIGVIRGERPPQLSVTLQDAENWGMHLHFVSRAEYREKTTPELLQDLHFRYGDFFEIPEGGANAEGVKGARVLGEAIYHQVKSDYTSVCLASGTTSSLAGIAAGLAQNSNAQLASENVIGFSVLKGCGDLGASVLKHQKNIGVETNNWRLISGYHAGGYAKKLPDYLQGFMTGFEREFSLQLDPVYTVKMCWGVAQLLTQNYWPRGSRLILIHTGGLQGRRGFKL